MSSCSACRANWARIQRLGTMSRRQMVEKATLVFMTRRDDRTYFWFGTPSVVHDFLAIISMSMWPWAVQGLVMRIYWSDHVN